MNDTPLGTSKTEFVVTVRQENAKCPVYIAVSIFIRHVLDAPLLKPTGETSCTSACGRRTDRQKVRDTVNLALHLLLNSKIYPSDCNTRKCRQSCVYLILTHYMLDKYLSRDIIRIKWNIKQVKLGVRQGMSKSLAKEFEIYIEQEKSKKKGKLYSNFLLFEWFNYLFVKWKFDIAKLTFALKKLKHNCRIVLFLLFIIHRAVFLLKIEAYCQVSTSSSRNRKREMNTFGTVWFDRSWRRGLFNFRALRVQAAAWSKLKGSPGRYLPRYYRKKGRSPG